MVPEPSPPPNPVHPWLAAIQRQVHPHHWNIQGLSLFNHFFITSLILAVLVQVLETEPTLRQPHGQWFHAADLLVGILFGIDFIMRFLAAGVVPRYRGVRGRLRYLLSWEAWLDLLALVPFLIYPWVDGLGANDLAFLRLFQGFKVVRAARLGRWHQAMEALYQALRIRRYELLVSFLGAFTMMLVAAVLLYLAEGKTQPAAFGSIPRALWWSMETLTTVGYGDVAPVTPLGRVFAGLVALAGIGVIALPTGILAAAFSDAFHRPKQPAESGGRTRTVSTSEGISHD